MGVSLSAYAQHADAAEGQGRYDEDDYEDDEEYEDEDARRAHILDATGPPTMPGLSHRGWAFNFEYLIASAEPNRCGVIRAARG